MFTDFRERGNGKRGRRREGGRGEMAERVAGGRKGGREREREKHRLVASHMCLNSRYVP